jgi:hypothetical protein
VIVQMYLPVGIIISGMSASVGIKEIGQTANQLAVMLLGKIRERLCKEGVISWA